MITEIEMAERIETMLKQDIYSETKYIIRRDGRSLIRKNQGIERHDIQLFSIEGPNRTSRNLANPDALVLNTETKKIEMILEYELDTNPKNLTANFITPFITDRYESNFSDDSGIIYELDDDITFLYLIVCLKKQRSITPREQAPLEKGELVRKKLLNLKEIIKGRFPIFDADIIIDDTLNGITRKMKESIIQLRK